MDIYQLSNKFKGKKIYIILSPIRNIINFVKYHLLTDKKAIEIDFKRYLGYALNLKKPLTLNEKLQWLKINQREKILTTCADKICVREYVEKKIGSKYLIPVCFYTYNIIEIDYKSMPDYPVIIKTNHDSSGGIIVKNKSEIDWGLTRKKLKKLCKKNYYYRTKEWPYKNIKPGILVEKLLIDEKNNIPNDYKFHCINGKVKMIQVDIDRNTNHRRNWYNKDWESLEFDWNASELNKKNNFVSKNDVPKPLQLNEMLRITEKLAGDFPYVRVDLYLCNQNIFFGELTFYHGSGYSPIVPIEYDKKLGDILVLPKQ